MGTTQPLTILVGKGISDAKAQEWVEAGHNVYRFTSELMGIMDGEYDGIISERAWRANDEMLKSTEGMMFKAMRAEKRARTPKPARKTRKPRKPKEIAT